MLLRDASGNAVGGQAVTLSVDGGPLDVAPTGPDTDGNGRWSATLTTTRVQTFSFLVRAGAIQLVATLPTQAALADVAHSALTLGPNVTTANGLEAAEAAVVLHDAFDNPVPAATVTFVPDVSGVTFSPNQACTDAAGVATIALSGGVAGTGTLSATAGYILLQQNLQLIAGSASDATVALRASPNLAVADEPASVALVLAVKDAQGNPVASEAVTFVTSGTGGQLVADAATDGIGTARATLRSCVAETKRITAVAGTAYAATNALFVAGESNAAASTLTAFPLLQTADGDVPVTFSLFVRDAAQNPVQNRAVSFAGTGVGTLGATGATTDATGRAQVVSTSLAAGPARVSTSAAPSPPT